MGKIILGILIFELVFSHAYCQDNLLAVDIPVKNPKPAAQENKVIPKEEVKKQADPVLEKEQPKDDIDKNLDKMRVYGEFLDNRQKELGSIRFDLEKSDLLLKKKENEKKIYDIEKNLPEGKKDGLVQSTASIDTKQPSLENADIKILLLLINGAQKEGIITLKGTPYSFQEGETIAAKLIVERINKSGITFKELDGSSLKVNFIN